jgi:DNA processing protein
VKGTDSKERLSMLALTYVQGLGVALFRQMVETAGSASEIFENLSSLPDILPGATPQLKFLLSDPEAFRRAEEELEFACTHNIDILCYNDDAYPYRLRECDDAPIVLYGKGNYNLNAEHIVSVIGTRKATIYGKDMCEKFVRELSELMPGTLVVSGLAYGIDICAHRTALGASLPTVGVLAHGLDRICTPVHRNTAKEMLENGGLLTEFMSRTAPLPANFVRRNRIVAGMSDATVVIESAAKGGSLITASIARSYDRDCFAYPGKTTDTNSVGCNNLIAKNRAALITSAADFVEAMNWEPQKKRKKKPSTQLQLFSDLSPEEELLMKYLAQYPEGVQVNRMVVDTNIPVNRLMTILFELEMKGLVRTIAGGRYMLANNI